MILLLACLLAGCKQTETAEGVRGRYRQMTGCTMEAAVACAGGEDPWRGTLRCHYVPEGESVIEVLEPEAIAGVEAVLEEGRWSLRFAGKRLDAGAVSREKISPAACLPRLMNALREGWLLEENAEEWNGVPCLRLTVDQSGEEAEKLYITVWLRQDDGTPLRGELAVEEETVLTADFTAFSFDE